MATAMIATATPVRARRWSPMWLVFSAALVAGVILFSRFSPVLSGFTVYWASNAVMLGIFLLVPRRQLALYMSVLLVVSTATNAVGNVIMGRPLNPVVIVAGLLTTGLALLVSVVVLRRDPAWIDGRTESVRSWLRFVVLGIVLPQLLGAILGTLRIVLAEGKPIVLGDLLMKTVVWFLPNVVSMFVLVPIMLRLRPGHLRRRGVVGSPVQLAGLLLLVAAVTALVMIQSQAVLLFVLVLPVVVLLFRHGTLGVALGAAILVPIVLVCTGAGTGPFVAAEGGDVASATIWAQVFVALLMATAYLITALLYEQERAALGGRVYRVIAENASDLVLLIDPSSVVQYAAPASTDALGVDAKELIGMEWHSLLHPEDVPAAEAAVDGLQSSDDVATFLCRIQHSDGTWRWFDARVKVAPKAVTRREHLEFKVALCRDVTEATERHNELQQENRELEEALVTDPLTGLANRRRLAAAQAGAWARAAESAEPLALLVADVDDFKAFNDRYGHAAGDRCLVDVADSIRAALRERSDTVAVRYGGEEFVVLLPRTGAAEARRVAQDVLRELRSRQVPHEDNPTGVVTVSIGVAVAEPAAGEDDGRLFAAADAALYQAKHRGRDRVEVAPASTG